MQLSVDFSFIDVARVEQLWSVFWSTRRGIAGAQRDAAGGRALLFELGSLAKLGVSRADSAIEDAQRS